MHVALVTSWSEGPRYTAVDDPPAPSADQLQLRVLAAGLHQVVRSRAAGRHYSATAAALPHVVGVDCVGRHDPTSQLYYVFRWPAGGTFAERLNVDRASAHPLPPSVSADDAVRFAASVNPALSSWMALTQRTANLPPGFTAVVLGATSASGRLAAHAARALGAGRVIGIARNAELLAALAGFDERVALREDPAGGVQETEFPPAVVRDCDVVLDYVGGEAAAHLLASLRTKKPVQYVSIGGLAGRAALTLPASVLRSCDLTIRGAGPGAWRLSALERELPALVAQLATWPLLEAQAVPLQDVERAWEDKELASKGRIVFVP